MRLVLDTNILVSALLSPDSSAFQILSDVLDGKYMVFISEEIYAEYDDVLHREKFCFDEEMIQFLLMWFKKNAVWIEVAESDAFMPDEKDRIFYDIAKCCKAKLVTGNRKHYPVDERITSLWEFDKRG